MSTTALLLVLVAAGVHASWNLLAKQARGPGAVFVWSYSALAVLAYSPLAAMVLVRTRGLEGRALLAIVVSGLLQVAYALVLQRGYANGDLSVVYPVARGSAPVLTLVLGTALLGEPWSAGLGVGVGLVAVGIIVIGGGRPDPSGTWSGVALRYGLATGAIIATYGVWDKHVVSALAVPPLLLDWGANLVRTTALWPHVARRRDNLAAGWSVNRHRILGVGLLSPLAYLLVLTALQTEPVTRVSPVREVSIVLATGLGTAMVGEPAGRRRVAGAAVVLAGVVLIAAT